MEAGHFRWTARRFSVRLEAARPLPCSAVSLAFFLPEQLGTTTISVKINGHELPSQVFRAGGECRYRQAIPPGAISSAEAEIEFALDKTAPPKPGDERELGLVVSFAREGCAVSDANLPLELE
jgi:hypothetical protein